MNIAIAVGDHFSNNHIFNCERDYGSFPTQFFIKLREEGKNLGFKINTYDLVQDEKLDAIIFRNIITIPHLKIISKNDYWELRKKHPNTKFILLICESPLSNINHFKKNHDVFDFVFTYNLKIVDNKKYFYIPLDFDLPKDLDKIKPEKNDFHKRKDICLVANNKKTTKKSLLKYIFYSDDLAKIKGSDLPTGFKYSLLENFNYFFKSLYNYRYKIASTIKKHNIDMDVYGLNWDEKNIKIKYPITDKIIMSEYKYVFVTENCLNQTGYISEKFFEVLANGSVPIYLGNKDICDFIPSNLFIFLNRKISARKISYLIKEISAEKWFQLRKNGFEYLQSEYLKKRTPIVLSKEMLNLLKNIV